MISTSRVQSAIADYIEIAGQFRRSAHLEKDYRGESQNGEYILTPTALESVSRLKEGLASNSASRAWTITGPYGVGKSSFAVFLTRLLCSTGPTALHAEQLIRSSAPDLSAELSALKIWRRGKKRFLPILVTARRAPASVCIAEGITAALLAEPSRKLRMLGQKLRAVTKSRRDGSPVDAMRILSSLERTALSARNEGYRGVLLIIDELGKVFEYAARYPQKSDVYLLQLMGEFVARSNGFPIMMLGLLHQSFEEYGQLLDIGTRREWTKIQGRFADIAFLEPTDQVIRLIAKAIRWKHPLNSSKFHSKVERVVDASAKAGAVPAGMPLDEFKRVAITAYPLHPVTLVAIPFIFRRFGQNERSLFSYLSSSEVGGFQEFLKTRQFSSVTPEFIRLGDLFDYFSSNFGIGLYRQPQALRWLEAADVLDRNDHLGETHREVVKTIGVLSALGQFCHLIASANMISTAIDDKAAPSKALEKTLTDLRNASLVTFRSYNDSFRIWEGSDVDIEERLSEARRKTQHVSGLAANVCQHMHIRPLIAPRHSFATGALRMFEIFYVDSIAALEEILRADSAMDGKIAVCLSESVHLSEQFRLRAAELKGSLNVLIAIPRQIGQLRGIATEIAALRWVWNNTPELRDDRVARKELSLQTAEVEQLLTRELGGLLDPRPEPLGSGCLWFHAGREQQLLTRADVSQLFSKVFDGIFRSCPRIHNELIVRRELSSAGAAARRKLIEAMLRRGSEPVLGIEGFPPQRSIYESVLRATGIHRQGADGAWFFSDPSKSTHHNLRPCWNFIFQYIFDRQPEPIGLPDLYAKLAAPPYGILPGLHPVILCAFMMVYPNETTLYREGSFLAEPTIADFELSFRRPELFAIAGSRVTGSRSLIVERIAHALKVDLATVPVVRALFRFAKSLPEFAWNTRSLSSATIGLREAFNSARSPEKFLFVEVPAALGLSPFAGDVLDTSEVERFFQALNRCLHEWSEAFPRTVDRAVEALLDACGVSDGDRGWEDLRRRSELLERIITEPQLLAFVRRVAHADAGRSGIESVCALIASRPPANWTDDDVERFLDAIRPIGSLFRNAIRSLNDAEMSEMGLSSLNSAEQVRVQRIMDELRARIDRLRDSESASVIRIVLHELLREMREDDKTMGAREVKIGK